MATTSETDGTGYAMGQEDTFTKVLQRRTSLDGGFFRKRLMPRMRLLDIGCGPGPITLELAALVHPANVIGVDNDGAMVERARNLASSSGVEAVTFEQADAYSLPFPDESFEAVHAQLVLMHLREPIRALKEIRRVLKPKGIAGIIDGDYDLRIIEPQTDAVRRLIDLEQRVFPLVGRSPSYARSQRRLLLEAGFAEAEQTAYLDARGTRESVEAYIPIIEGVVRGTAAPAMEHGWIDGPSVESLVQELTNLARRPDAFLAIGYCVAIGIA